MPDTRKIRGEVTLGYRDELGFHLIRLPSYLIGVVLVLALFVTACWWWLLPADARDIVAALRGGDPVVYWLKDIGYLLLLLTGLSVLWIFLGACLQFRRLVPEHRTLDYEADAEALTTRDASGVMLRLPWSTAARIQVSGPLLLVQYRWGAWRYVPLRAFASEDRARLLAYARREALPDPDNR